HMSSRNAGPAPSGRSSLRPARNSSNLRRRSSPPFLFALSYGYLALEPLLTTPVAGNDRVGVGTESLLELLQFLSVRFLLCHCLQDRFQESPVLRDGDRIVRGERPFHRALGCGRHNFEPAHEHAHGL